MVEDPQVPCCPQMEESSPRNIEETNPRFFLFFLFLHIMRNSMKDETADDSCESSKRFFCGIILTTSAGLLSVFPNNYQQHWTETFIYSSIYGETWEQMSFFPGDLMPGGRPNFTVNEKFFGRSLSLIHLIEFSHWIHWSKVLVCAVKTYPGEGYLHLPLMINFV